MKAHTSLPSNMPRHLDPLPSLFPPPNLPLPLITLMRLLLPVRRRRATPSLGGRHRTSRSDPGSSTILPIPAPPCSSQTRVACAPSTPRWSEIALTVLLPGGDDVAFRLWNYGPSCAIAGCPAAWRLLHTPSLPPFLPSPPPTSLCLPTAPPMRCLTLCLCLVC